MISGILQYIKMLATIKIKCKIDGKWTEAVSWRCFVKARFF